MRAWREFATPDLFLTLHVPTLRSRSPTPVGAVTPADAIRAIEDDAVFRAADSADTFDEVFGDFYRERDASACERRPSPPRRTSRASTSMSVRMMGLLDIADPPQQGGNQNRADLHRSRVASWRNGYHSNHQDYQTPQSERLSGFQSKKYFDIEVKFLIN